MATVDNAQLSAQPQSETFFTVHKRGQAIVLLFIIIPCSIYNMTLSCKDIEITMKEVAEHFGKTLKDATAVLGVSSTTLKRGIRAMGIARWPGRQVRSLEKSVLDLDKYGEGVNIDVAATKASLKRKYESMKSGDLDSGIEGPPPNLYKQLYDVKGRELKRKRAAAKAADDSQTNSAKAEETFDESNIELASFEKPLAQLPVKRGRRTKRQKKTVESAVQPQKKTVERAVQPQKKTVEGAVRPQKKTAKGAVRPQKKTAKGAVRSQKKTVKGAVQPQKKTVEKAVQPSSSPEPPAKLSVRPRRLTKREKTAPESVLSNLQLFEIAWIDFLGALLRITHGEA